MDDAYVDIPLEGVEDMISMNNLSPETILENVKRRYDRNNIYTYVGSILVSINPYQLLPIYGNDVLRRYNGANVKELSPHIFAVAERSYADMRGFGRNQSILISGESGAGKTEAAKVIIQYLSVLSAKHSLVEQIIADSSPILESFGNAKTVRNNNSSRFGKFIEIEFDETGIVGAKIAQYLLEKSRLVKQAPNERNYHIFYQLIGGSTPEERDRMKLGKFEDYYYLNQSGCTTLADVDEKKYFTQVRAALRISGITPEMQSKLFNVLASILHLGNVTYKNDGDTVSIENPKVVHIAAQLLEVDEHELAKILTQRKIEVNKQAIYIPLKPNEANGARDSITKAIYGAVFIWLVSTINGSLQQEHYKWSIGVLDIFGFENFEKNSFEQLCINYANEKLQQFFNQYVFKEEQTEYEKEGIDWTKIDFVDNIECVYLIEKKPIGVLAILDEESKFPKATDLTFLGKLHQNCEKHKYYEKSALDKDRFSVKHFAGKITYNVTGWLEKNVDQQGLQELRELSANSANQMFKLFFAVNEGAVGRTITVGTQFKSQLESLSQALNATAPNFVKCIKPNMAQKHSMFVPEMVQEQLRYSGLLETAKIRKAGYPFRQPFMDFIKRYKVCFGNKAFDPKMAPAEVTKHIALSLGFKEFTWQVGKSKIFFRSDEALKLESLRKVAVTQVVILIQKVFRGWLCRTYYKQLRISAIKIQTSTRKFMARKKYLALKHAAILAQSLARKRIAMKKYKVMVIAERKRKEEERRRKEEEERRRKEEEKKRKEEEERLLKEKLKNLSKEERKKAKEQAKKEQEEREKLAALEKAKMEEMEKQASLTPKSSTRSSAEGPRLNRAPSHARSVSRSQRSQTPAMPLEDPFPEPVSAVIIKPEESEKYKFSDYAKEHFQQITTGVLRKKTKTWDKLYIFSKKLRHALLKATPEYHNKLAIEAFSAAVAYMEDSNEKQSQNNLNMVIKTGIEYPDMRNEIYCHLLKQLNNNPKEASVFKGFELLAFVTGIFHPDDVLTKYVASFLITTASKGDAESQKWAKYCLHRLQRTVATGTRFDNRPISTPEIQTVKHREDIKYQVKLPDGRLIPVEIDSASIAKEVFVQVAKAINLPNHYGFSLFGISADIERSLGPKEKICTLFSSWEAYQKLMASQKVKVEFGLLFKKQFFFHKELPANDGLELELLYFQASDEIQKLGSSYNLGENVAAALAAIQYQVRTPDQTLTQEAALQFLPKGTVSKKVSEKLTENIMAKHAQLDLKNKSRHQLMRMYLQFASTLPMYGTALFTVQKMQNEGWEDLEDNFEVAVNSTGVHIVNAYNKQIIKSFSYSQISNFKYDYPAFTLILDSAGSEKKLTFKTMQCADLSTYIEGYISELQRIARYCKAIADHDATAGTAGKPDGELLFFKKGDVIELDLDNDLSSDWFRGMLNGKSGIFPRANVLILVGTNQPGPSTQAQEDKPAMVRRRSSVVVAVDTAQYNISDFVRDKTRAVTRGKKTLDSAARMAFSKDPITEPLLQSTPDNLQKEAVNLFAYILKFMGGNAPIGLTGKSKNQLAQYIAQKGIDEAGLRDEIYCQLYKQTNNNSKMESLKRGWQLINICAGCFAPTEQMLNYMQAYISQSSNHTSAEVSKLAKAALRRMQHTVSKGPRKLAPSSIELAAIKEGIPWNVILRLGGKSGPAKEVVVESITTVGELANETHRIFGFKRNVTEYSLNLPAAHDCYAIMDDEKLRVGDVLAKFWANKKPGKKEKAVVIFRRRFFVDFVTNTSDPAELDLAFAQAAEDVRTGKLRINTFEEAIELASYHLHALKGICTELHSEEFKEVVPEFQYDQFKKSNDDWSKKILLLHSQAANITVPQAKLLYLQKVQENVLCGSTYFFVEQTKEPNKVWMAINELGIYILNSTTLETLEKFKFEDISNWSEAPQSFTVVTGSLVAPTSNVYFTDEAKEINTQFQWYFKTIKTVREQVKAAEATTPDFFTGLGSRRRSILMDTKAIKGMAAAHLFH